VYFNATQTFMKESLKIPVHQKETSLQVPVCYCFDWTKERLIHSIQSNDNPVDHIRKQLQANRWAAK
jgi:hypothetical protein